MPWIRTKHQPRKLVFYSLQRRVRFVHLHVTSQISFAAKMISSRIARQLKTKTLTVAVWHGQERVVREPWMPRDGFSRSVFVVPHGQILRHRGGAGPRVQRVVREAAGQRRESAQSCRGCGRRVVQVVRPHPQESGGRVQGPAARVHLREGVPQLFHVFTHQRSMCAGQRFPVLLVRRQNLLLPLCMVRVSRLLASVVGSVRVFVWFGRVLFAGSGENAADREIAGSADNWRGYRCRHRAVLGGDAVGLRRPCCRVAVSFAAVHSHVQSVLLHGQTVSVGFHWLWLRGGTIVLTRHLCSLRVFHVSHSTTNCSQASWLSWCTVTCRGGALQTRTAVYQAEYCVSFSSSHAEEPAFLLWRVFLMLLFLVFLRSAFLSGVRTNHERTRSSASAQRRSLQLWTHTHHLRKSELSHSGDVFCSQVSLRPLMLRNDGQIKMLFPN